jgi:histidinol-phosphate aminotransferase
MSVSRRDFLAAAAAASAAISWPSLAFGEPRRVGQPGGPILLHSNENAYGPFPEVMAAMRGSLAKAHRYPDRAQEQFLTRLAEFQNVSVKQLVVGCGSTDILRMAAEAFTGPDRKLIVASPTFEALGEYATMRGAEVVKVPLRSDFAHDLTAMLAKIDGNTGLIYICNPNNPTGSLTPAREIDNFLSHFREPVTVLVDEAYHHFADGATEYRSVLGRASQSERVIVCRTFSKVYGLAGLRLGYAVGTPETVAQLASRRTFDNVNTVAAHCAGVALENAPALAAAISRNARDRASFLSQAAARRLKTIPSYANFIMLDTSRDIREVIQHFEHHRILVGRPFPPLNTYLRVSLGTPSEMAEFWRVWDLMRN